MSADQQVVEAIKLPPSHRTCLIGAVLGLQYAFYMIQVMLIVSAIINWWRWTRWISLALLCTSVVIVFSVLFDLFFRLPLKQVSSISIAKRAYVSAVFLLTVVSIHYGQPLVMWFRNYLLHY